MPSGVIEQLRQLLKEYFKPLSTYQTHHANDAANPGPLWLYREQHLLATDFEFKLSQIQIPETEDQPEYLLAKHLKKKLELEKNATPLKYSMSSLPLSMDELSQLVHLAMNQAAGFSAKHATSLLITLLMRDADSTLHRTQGLALLEGGKLDNPKFKLNSDANIPKEFPGLLHYTFLADKVDESIGNLGKAFVDLSHSLFYSEVDKRIKIDALSLKGQDLRYSQFRWLTLPNCNFSFCDLNDTQFEHCEGTSVNMRGASLHRAEFKDCLFSKPNFQWVILRNAIFKNTQLGTDANNKADLQNCDFNDSQFDKDSCLSFFVENAGTILPDTILNVPHLRLSTSVIDNSSEIKYRSVKKKLFDSSKEHADSLPYYWTSTRAKSGKPLRGKINDDELVWFIKQLFNSTSDSLYYQSRFEGVRLERAHRQGRLFAQIINEVFNPLTHIGLLGCTEVLNIEHYENQQWWTLYQRAKAELKDKLRNANPQPLAKVAWHAPEFDPLLDAAIGECVLIHGNSNKIIDSILQHGFKRTADKPDELRGWGALGRGGPYLTDAIPKAMHYTKCPTCDSEQCHCVDGDLLKPRKLLFCRVLLGKIEPTKNDRDHRFDRHLSVKFDSVYGPTQIEVPESHFKCNEFLPLEPAGTETYFLHPRVYPEFILTVRQHQKKLSKEHALELKEKNSSSIPIVEKCQQDFTKHEKYIEQFNLNQIPLNKIIECIETYYRLLNHQTPPRDKCFYALSILSENCKIALNYYKNIKDLFDVLEKLDKNIANENARLEQSVLSRNTQNADQLIEHIRQATLGHHYLCSALQTKANAEAKSRARDAIMAFSSMATQSLMSTSAIALMRLESALAHTVLDQHREAIEDILFIYKSHPTDENIKSYWNYCINLTPKMTLELLIHLLAQQSNSQKLNQSCYSALSQAISRAFGDANAFKWGDDAVVFILSCYQSLTRAEKTNCIEALTKLKPNDRALSPLLERLRHAQEPDGWYYELGIEENNWQVKLKQSFFNVSTAARSTQKIKIFKDQYQNQGANFYFCTPEIETQILKLFNIIDGTLKIKNPSEPGNHTTLRVVDNLNKHVFWLKIAPEQAATEFSVNLLDRLVTGYAQTPKTCMMLIQHADNPTQPIAVQISSAAPGEVLSKTINKQEVILKPENLAKLTLSSFLHNLLRVLLINPEDDKGDDYFLYQTKDGYQLFRVDNERAFYKMLTENPADITKFRLKSTQVMQVKSILYCLEQMNSPLDQDAEAKSVLEQFCALDCQSVLKTWLNELKHWHQQYAALFRDIMADHSKRFPDCVLALTNPSSAEIIQVVNRFESLQEIISHKLSANSTIIGLDLLTVLNKDLVNPQLPNNYRNAFTSNPVGRNSPQEQAKRVTVRFDQVVEGLYAFNPHTGRRYSTTPPRMLNLAEVLSIASSKESPIVSQAWEALSKLKDEKLSEITKGILQQDEDKTELFNKQDDSTKRVIFRKIFTAIQQDKNHSIGVKVKKYILQILLGSPIYDLPLNLFSDCGINEEFIKELCLKNGTYILKLNLDDCQFLTPEMLEIIGLGCININVLSCKRSNIDLLKGAFPTLETLHLDHCTSITKIDLMAQKLKILSAVNCQKLSRVRTGSDQLETANFMNCTELTGKNIAKLTSPTSHPKVIKLGSTKISPSHRVLLEAYPFLVMLPLENISESFLEKIKIGLDATFIQYSITTADIDHEVAKKIVDDLTEHLKACLDTFSYVKEKRQNLFLQVWPEAVDFLGQVEVVDYYIDKSDEDNLIKDLLSWLSSEKNIRCSVASALGEIGANPRLVEPLLKAIIDRLCKLPNDPDPNLQRSVVSALGQIGTNPILTQPQRKIVIDRLCELLRDPACWVKSSLVSILGQLGANPTLATEVLVTVITVLCRSLKDSDHYVTHCAAIALQNIGTSPALVQQSRFEVLIEGLSRSQKDLESHQRSFVVETLGKIGTNPRLTQPQLERVFADLFRMLGDPDSYVTRSAVIALSQIGAAQTLTRPQFQKVIARLRELQKDSRPSLPGYANVALFRMEAAQFPELADRVFELLGYSGSIVALSASTALGQIDWKTSLSLPPLGRLIDRLFELLQTDESLFVVSVFSQMGSNPTLPQPLFETLIDRLYEFQAHSERNIRWHVVSILGQIGEAPTLTQPQFERVIEHICKLSKDPNVSDCATIALGKIIAAHPIFNSLLLLKVYNILRAITLLKGRQIDVICKAIIALGEIGANNLSVFEPLIVPHLLELLKNSDLSLDIRSAAAIALKMIAEKQGLSTKRIEEILAVSPKILSALYSTDYIDNLIDRSLRHSGLMPPAEIKEEKAVATSTRFAVSSSYSPRLFPTRQQHERPPTNVAATHSTSSTSSHASETVATNSSAFEQDEMNCFKF